MAIRKRGTTWWIDITTPGGQRVRQSAETTDRKAAQELHDRLKNDLWRQAKLGDKPKYSWEDAALRWLNEQAHKASIRDDAKKIELLTPFFRRLPLTELTWDRMQSSDSAARAQLQRIEGFLKVCCLAGSPCPGNDDRSICRQAFLNDPGDSC